MVTEKVGKFWKEFCDESGVEESAPFQVWYFGNSSEQARELANLVIFADKRATASLVEFNAAHPEVAPVDDGFSVVTDFEGEPMCVIQTTEIRHVPFDEVDAQFAFDEGEGDRTLADWRAGHNAYFSREAREFGLEFNDKTLICCERFRLLYPAKK